MIWVQSKKKVIWKWWNCYKTDLFRQGCDDLLYEHNFVEWASHQGIKMRPYSEASHVFLIAHLSRITLRGRRLIGYKRLNNKEIPVKRSSERSKMHCLTIIIALLVFGECRVLVQGRSTRNNSVHRGFFMALFWINISWKFL